MTLAGRISLTAFDNPSSGVAVLSEPGLGLTISLVDTTGAQGVATPSGNFTIQTTQVLEAFDNPAFGAAATPRKVQFFGSCIITSEDRVPVSEF